MLNKYGHTFEATCDFCDADLDTDEDEFMSAVEALKRADWKVFRANGEWNHKCSDCCSGSANDFDVVE